jgi:hypothetical protein
VDRTNQQTQLEGLVGRTEMLHAQMLHQALILQFLLFFNFYL